MHLPKTDVISGYPVLRYFHLGEIVHANANKGARYRRRDLVVRDFRVHRSGCEEAICGPVEQFVAVHVDILATQDEDVGTREPADREAGDGDVLNRCLHFIDALVLDDEIVQFHAMSGHANACLAVWTCDTGASVLDGIFGWSQFDSITDKRDSVRSDKKLLSIVAGVNDDAAAAWCRVYRSLDRVAGMNMNYFVISTAGYTQTHKVSTMIQKQGYGLTSLLVPVKQKRRWLRQAVQLGGA
jgi:hypothetical protein